MNSALSAGEVLMEKQQQLGETLVIGSRKSQLAMVQTELVQRLLSETFPALKLSILGIATTGDKILDVALYKIGTKSLFTKELEVALADRSVDFVVHSLKDMPTTLPVGMALGATLEREDPRDAVVMSRQCQGLTLSTLPRGSVVGTSSVRRSAQLKRRFPDLVFQDVVCCVCLCGITRFINLYTWPCVARTEGQFKYAVCIGLFYLPCLSQMLTLYVYAKTTEIG